MFRICILAWALMSCVPTDAAVRTVKLGLASNFSEVSSNSFNPYGDYFRNGIQLALKDSQGELKKKGIQILFEEFDYGTNSVRVLEAARQAVSSSVIGVIGYEFSTHALLAAPIHQDAKLPMIAPSATADRIGEFGPFVHPGCFNNSFMGKTLAGLAKEKFKAKKAVIIVAADCAYCEDLAESFQYSFIHYGGKIISKISVLASDTVFLSVVKILKKQDFDVILIPNQELNTARIISTLVKGGINRPFLGGDGWGNIGQELFAVLGDTKFKGLSVTHWHPDVHTSRSDRFSRAYLAQFNKNPNDTSVLAYDAMLLVVQALLRTNDFSRRGLEGALNQIKEFQGVTGHAIFSPHSAPEKSLVVLSPGQGRFNVLDVIHPSRNAF